MALWEVGLVLGWTGAGMGPWNTATMMPGCYSHLGPWDSASKDQVTTGNTTRLSSAGSTKMQDGEEESAHDAGLRQENVALRAAFSHRYKSLSAAKSKGLAKSTPSKGCTTDATNMVLDECAMGAKQPDNLSYNEKDKIDGRAQVLLMRDSVLRLLGIPVDDPTQLAKLALGAHAPPANLTVSTGRRGPSAMTDDRAKFVDKMMRLPEVKAANMTRQFVRLFKFPKPKNPNRVSKYVPTGNKRGPKPKGSRAKELPTVVDKNGQQEEGSGGHNSL